MTSLQLQNKAASAHTAGSDCAHEREGIFDQFAENSSPDLYYYAVYSSSDSEGNVTVLDVTRQKFGSDVRLMPKGEHDGADNERCEAAEEKGDEEKEINKKSLLSQKKRYGFRTRRLKNHRDDDFDTTLCESSDESGEEDPKYIPSSDDETYDIAADNWVFVRGSKKKANDLTKKKNESPKKIKKEETPPETKSKPLKIKLKSTFRKDRQTRLRRFAKTLKKGRSAFSRRTEETQAKRQVPLRPPNKIHKRVQSDGSTSKSVTKEEPGILKEVAPSIGHFPKKSPNKIRFGYNSTAPKIPEIRHIRRRQLRQTPSRIAAPNSAFFDEGSTSSEEEMPISMKTRAGRKFSRMHSLSSTLNEEKATKNSPERRPIKRVSSVDSSTTVTSRGNGLKLVIRRQSVDHCPAKSVNHNRRDENTNSPRPGPNTSNQALQSEVTKDFEKVGKPGIPNTVSNNQTTNKFQTQQTINEMGHISNTENGFKTVESAGETQPENKNRDAEERKTDETIAKDTSPSSIDEEGKDSECGTPTNDIVDATSRDQQQKGSSESNQKTNIEDEPVKKKKSKKKRKKERGRTASSAGTEDACDAEYTEMRLAMELPRYNWLVKHLIKENKIKAEDDKPLNNLREADETTSQTPTKSNLARKSSNSESEKTQESPKASPEKVGVNSCTTPPIEEQSARTEEIPEDVRNHQNNYLKGSSMVGIVKPFQHLKMSPSNLKGEDFSPPPLCIVDDEESASQSRAVSSGATELKASGSGTLNPNPKSQSSREGSSNGTANSNDANAASSCCAKLDSKFTTSVASHPQVTNTVGDDVSTGLKKLTPISGGSSEHISALADSMKEIPRNPARDMTFEVQYVTAKDDHREMEERKEPAISNPENLCPSPEKPSNSDSNNEVESESEIKISSCFSLALDLTKKVERETNNIKIEANDDQPLDLSMRSKRGQISPKVLDLSIKKTNTTVKSTPSTSVNKNSGIDLRPKSAAGSLRRTSQQTSSPSVVPRSAASGQENIEDKPNVPTSQVKQDQKGDGLLVIKDRCPTPQVKPDKKSDGLLVIKDKCKPEKLPSSKASAPPSTADIKRPTVNRTPKKPLVSGATTSQPAVKRCASYDSTAASNASPVPVKCSRMSLDESKLLKTSLKPPEQLPKSEVPSSSAKTPNLRSRSVSAVAAADQNKSALQPPVSAGTGVVSAAKVEKPFVSSVPSLPIKVPPSHAHPRPEVAKFFRDHPVKMSLPLPPSQQRPPAIPDRSLIATPGLSGSDTSNKSPIMTQAPGTPPQKRIHRNRSMEANNNTAQLVAQAYRPDIRHLEPYIKEQQRVVDERIQELEALKRQLANASSVETGIVRSQPQHHHPPPPPYIETSKPVRQIQHYNPPLPRPISLPSTRPMSAQTISSVQKLGPRNPLPAAHPKTVPMPLSPGLSLQRLPRPVLPSSSSMQRHIPPIQTQSQWRTLGPRGNHQPMPTRLLVQRPISSGNVPADRLQVGPDKMYQQITASARMRIDGPRRMAAPRAYSQPHPHLRAPRMQPVTRPNIPFSAAARPLYRNGGLTVNDTFRTKLNEPIVIEDDIVRNNNNLKRSAPPPNSNDSLKIRRAHSYHPPLSKNYTKEPQKQQFAVQNRWPTPRPTTHIQGPRATETAGESCIRCRGKAFYLCSGCRKIWYCSKECQLQDWNSHSAVCNG